MRKCRNPRREMRIGRWMGHKRAYGRALSGVTVEETKGDHKFHRVNGVAAVIHGKKESA
ncbi:hypothetical protein Holit_03054 [Hollandina sp. SP2]